MLASKHDREGDYMDRTELGITVLGLLATFLLPWPLAGEQGDAGADGLQRMVAAERFADERMVVPVAHTDGAGMMLGDQPAR
jgi:hypothetical protein